MKSVIEVLQFQKDIPLQTVGSLKTGEGEGILLQYRLPTVLTFIASGMKHDDTFVFRKRRMADEPVLISVRIQASRTVRTAIILSFERNEVTDSFTVIDGCQSFNFAFINV